MLQSQLAILKSQTWESRDSRNHSRASSDEPCALIPGQVGSGVALVIRDPPGESDRGWHCHNNSLLGAGCALCILVGFSFLVLSFTGFFDYILRFKRFILLKGRFFRSKVLISYARSVAAPNNRGVLNSYCCSSSDMAAFEDEVRLTGGDEVRLAGGDEGRFTSGDEVGTR